MSDPGLVWLSAACALLVLFPAASAEVSEEPAWSADDARGDQSPWPANYDLLQVSFREKDDGLTIQYSLAGSPMDGRASYFLGFEAGDKSYSITCWYGPEIAAGAAMRADCSGSADANGSPCVQDCEEQLVEQPSITSNGTNAISIFFPYNNFGTNSTAGLLIEPKLMWMSVTLAIEQPTYSETTLVRTDQVEPVAGFRLQPSVMAQENESVTTDLPEEREAPAIGGVGLVFALVCGLMVRRRTS